MATVNYCGLSGGKDSSATALWLIHESGIPRESIRFTFCDTGNEHEWVYQHIAMLSRRFQEWGCAPVVTLKPERDFYALAKWKKRFPSRKARFCTQYLKVIPSREDITALIRADHEVIVHSGVRAGESADRAKLIERGFDDMFGCVVNRPLLRWTLADVIALHQKYDVPLNPLYGLGFTRVGCFPCINSRKREIKLISIHFPERIDMLERAEAGIEPNVLHSFFARKTVPPRFRTHRYTNRKGIEFIVASIRDVVRWSHTGHRAKEIQKEHLLDYDLIEEDRSLFCPSGMGMCE